MKWIFLAVGLITGWLARGKHEANKVLNSEPAYCPASTDAEPPEFQQLATDWETVMDEQFAQREHPEDDVPDEIEVPSLPFENEEDEPEEEPDALPPISIGNGIEMISEEDYIGEYMAYGKDSLIYFHEVRQLTFGDEDPIDDQKAMAGNVHDYFFDEAGRQLAEVVYIRNHRYGLDAMICLKPGAPYWYESE